MHFLVLFLICEYKLKMQTETPAFSTEGVNMVPDELLCTEWGLRQSHQRALLLNNTKLTSSMDQLQFARQRETPSRFRKFKKVEQLSSTVEVVENEI